ncbi:paramyosin-like [Capsicum annuum]
MDTSLIHVQSPYIEMMKNNFFFFRSSTNDANKTPSPPLKSKEVSSWRSISLSSRSFYDSGSGKNNFMDLSKSPHGHNLSVPVLIRTIRRFTKEKVQMASEVSSMLRNQVAERVSAKEEASILQAELDSRTRRLETEKNELQSVMEKELDRRSSNWSLKLEKYQIEQHRLRERARELAEQNVSLQRKVFSFNEKEVDNRNKMPFSEKYLEDLSKRIEQVSKENQNLWQQLTQLQAEYRVAQDNRDYVWENYQEKVKELKSETLQATVLREKLHSKEMDTKQLQDDLAATVRGNDILKCEVQNTLDALFCATPKLKYVEL